MPAKTSPLLPADLVARLERLELVTRKIFRGRRKGERRSKRKGQSVEFADFRSYVPGDDLRFLDWNLYARLDRLFLKMFQEEEDLHFYTLLDASASMAFGEPTKFDWARQLAAALGFVGLVRGDRVKIEPLASTTMPPGPVLRGRRNVWRMIEYLEQLRAEGSLPFAQQIKNFCLRNSGKGIVVLITDLMHKEGYQVGLRYLSAQNLDVYIIHVLADEECEPAVSGDLKLVDCEDRDEADVTISRPLMDRYRQSLTGLTADARQFCSRRGMTYLQARNSLGVSDMVLQYLRGRGLMR